MMKKENVHIIKSVKPGSIANELEIEAGDILTLINGEKLEDIFDYQYLMEDTYVEVTIQKANGEEWVLEIDKDEDEDLGIEFENGLMDEYRSCHNKCIFCFIDQMPPGMRPTLYFKDDDSRLSFLQGNYVTLTNMSEHDIERVCKYRLEPINISFQTMNPELRCKMLNNRFAGEALKKVDRFYEAGIRMNGQIVLCKGINDDKELEFSIRELKRYIPYLESVSVVPVGLSKFREGLFELEPFDRESAERTIDIIEKFQREIYAEHGCHFVHASDEWYLLAGRELPKEERYDGYLQLENGVGMLRLLLDEFYECCEDFKWDETIDKLKHRRISMITGMLSYPVIQGMLEALKELFPNIEVMLYPIVNDFFGHGITVSGLLTGQDIIAQLKGRDLGELLYIPENVLRSGEATLLDDYTVPQLQETLQVPIDIVKSNGLAFVEKVYGIDYE